VDNWVIIGLLLLFWPVVVAGLAAAAALVLFLWLLAISAIKGIWGDFFGR
jgi:hypothetical protein